MRQKNLLTLSCLLAVLCQVAPFPARAAQDGASVIAVRSGEHASFDRVVFDWPRQVPYVLKKDGDKVRIEFSAIAKPAFDATSIAHLSRARGFASVVEGEKLVVSFSVDAAADVKAFTSGNSVAVDITAPASRAAPPSIIPPVAAKAEAKTEAKAPTPVSKTESVSHPPENITPEATAAKTDKEVKSTDVKTEAPPEKPAEKPADKPAEKPSDKPAEKPSDKPSVKPAEKPADAPAKSGDIAPTPKADAREKVVVKSLPTVPSTGAALSRHYPASLDTDVGTTPLLVLTLDPRVPTRAAIYLRAGYVYVIFDRAINVPASDITGGQPSRVISEPLALPKVAGFRFAVPDNVEVHAMHEGTAWNIYISRKADGVAVSTTLVAQPNFALGARFLLPLPEAPEPVRFTDPIVGDDLIIVPLALNQAFSVARNMADFQIIPAVQGMVLRPLTDKVVVRPVTDGIEISAEGGLRLSSSTDTGASQQSSQKEHQAELGKSIFDFASWRGKPEEDFTKTRQRLLQTIVDVPESERHRARLELARFYFSQGNGEEAMSILNYMAKQLPDLKSHADFISLLGASQILAYRTDEGLKTLDMPQVQDQAEIGLWRAVGAAQLRNWKEAEEHFALGMPILYGYPEPFRSRFTILAVESAIAMERDHEAADWLAQLETNTYDPVVQPAMRYLHAVLHAKAGRAQAAEAAWKDVLETRDRLYKVRAEMALTDLGVSTRSLTPAQAVDRLEALRFAWRGDDLEVDILHRLGQFYIQAKNVKAGLNVMARATQLYPSSPLVPQIKAEMAKTFHDVFLTDAGASLSPLDALTLYQQYKNLMPTGKDGDVVMSNLSERLVAVDLLEQAASLLDDLVKTRLQGEDKARTGTRLAAIRLLDHKPDAALSALEDSNSGFLPPDIQNDRLLLRAKALSALQRDEEALTLLRDNNRISAKVLRADITMHAKKWSDAAKALLDLVGAPPAAGELLNADQADWLVNCAIAYSLAGDTTGLDKLAIDYGAAMAGTKQSDTFRILTSPEKATQLRDITAAQARIADVDLFQGFLNNYRKADTAPATPKKP